MTEIEAAIGLVQTSKIKEITEKRIRNANILSYNFEKVEQINSQYVPENAKSAYHFYPIMVSNVSRNKLLDFLRGNGIMAAVHYRPVYLFPPHGNLLGLKEGHCAVSEDIYSRVISLPCHQGLAEDDMMYIAEKVVEGIERFSGR